MLYTYEECFSAENLLKMHKLCRKSKTHKKEVIGFELNLAENITNLSNQLLNQTYKVSKYRTFNVYEPKERLIEALPYKDRLVQMALCTCLVAPKLESRLICDNVACRKNKGTSFALKRLKYFLVKHYKQSKNSGYFLKIDISKYFANINHQVLKLKLKKSNFCNKTLNLLYKFIDSNKNYVNKGLPLGNQTSQWFALIYLDKIDRLIKEQLKFKYYIRYMDDLILIDSNKNKLHLALQKIKQVANENLKLNLNKKTQIGRLCDGIDFVGFRTILLKTGKVLQIIRSQAKRKIVKRFKFYKLLFANGLSDKNYISTRIASYKGYLLKSNSNNLIYNLLSKYTVM